MKNGVPWRERRRLRLEAESAARREKGKRLHPPVTPKPSFRKVPEDHNPHGSRGIIPWSRTDKWRGRVFCVVGGGPSLKDPLTVERMQQAKLDYPDAVWIVVNNSYELIPDADILHFADHAWFVWNHKDVYAKFKGIITTATSEIKPPLQPSNQRVKRFWRNRNTFSEDPQRLHGWDGGTQAVNMAYHLGARKVVLWGIDMCVPPGETPQWHTKHRRSTNVVNYQKRFAPCLAEVVRLMGKLGVPVVRATEPGIPEAPCLPVEEAMA